MFCTNCGKEIIDTAKFCNFCGSPILNAAASVPVQPVSPVTPTPTVQPTPGFSESADVPVTENNYGSAVGEEAEIAENNNETIPTEAAAVENTVPEEASIAVDTNADIHGISNTYNESDVPSATNAPNVPTPNTIPTYGNSEPVYSAPLAYPSPAQSIGTIPVQSAEPTPESKPERKYTLGHIMMCLAAVAVMAIVAGVFAGLYFSVV